MADVWQRLLRQGAIHGRLLKCAKPSIAVFAERMSCRPKAVVTPPVLQVRAKLEL